MLCSTIFLEELFLILPFQFPMAETGTGQLPKHPPRGVVGNFLDKMPRDCLGLSESKSKVRYSRDKAERRCFAKMSVRIHYPEFEQSPCGNLWRCSFLIETVQPSDGNVLSRQHSEKLDRTNALADSGASINLFPHSIYKQLGLGALKPTRMTLELASHSVTHPMGIAEDVVVRVGLDSNSR
ncbi:reverse transcriptase domain-containing protein [Tanacetum coccineum]